MSDSGVLLSRLRKRNCGKEDQLPLRLVGAFFVLSVDLYSLWNTGTALLRPISQWSVIVGTIGSVDALARGLAVDLAPIRVNTVCPGYVDTEVRGVELLRKT